MKKIVVAGATGYLGGYVVRELKQRNYWVRVLIRKEQQKEQFKDVEVDDYFIGEITQPETLVGVCADMDWAFTSVGITRQKDGLTYMDVDYRGNLNLLHEAKKANVALFQYVSAVNADKMRQVKILEAKEKFVDELKTSGMNYSIIRPNGFFSDMGDFLDMAKSGRVYLFGNGEQKLNPIHGADLAKVCVDKLEENVQEATAGGPDILSQNEIGALALKALNKPVKISHFPDWIRRFIIWSLRRFASVKTYGPYEFFLTTMASDNVADQYGTHHLKDLFEEKAKSIK